MKKKYNNEWRKLYKKLTEKYTLTLISKGPWGNRFQFAHKNQEDNPQRYCITAKTAQEAVLRGRELLKHEYE